MLWPLSVSISFLFVLMVVGPSMARLVDIRAGGHGELERVVVELTERREFHIEREGRAIVIAIKEDGSSSSYDRRLPEGALFKVLGLEEQGGWLRVRIGLLADVDIKESSLDEPFRIVVDLKKKRKVKKKMENKLSLSTLKERAKTAQPRAHRRKTLSIEDIPLIPSNMKLTTGKDKGVEFNDGWRWVYRKYIYKRLVFLEDGEVELERLVGGMLDEEELKELKSALKGMHGSQWLMQLRERYKGMPAAGAIRFVQAYVYERKGFYPEAIAHYRMVVDELGDEEVPLTKEAYFREGLVLFLQSRFADAIEPLRKAYSLGHRRAAGYLASVFLIRGEVVKAWRLFTELKGSDHAITTMGVADISMGAGRYRHARLLYRKLFNRYPEEGELSAYFMLRMGDSYIAEGSLARAIEVYTKIKDGFSDEARVIGILGLAEALAKRGDRASLKKAENLYKEVISYDYKGAEYAYTALADIEARLGRYQRAILYLEEMGRRFPTGEFRYRAYNMRGYIVHRWIDSLFKRNDYHMVARIYRIYEKEIPFGLKANTYLAAGRALAELSLYREAIEALKNAVKMGKQDISQEALVLIGYSYMKLDELSRAQRVIEGFLESYPQSKLKDRAIKVLAMVYHAKGEHKRLAAIKSKDPEVLLLKASSLYNLHRYKEAERLFATVAREFSKDREKEEKVAHIYITMGDIAFLEGNYKRGVEYYIEAKRRKGWLSKDDVAWIELRLAEGYRRLGPVEAAESLVEEFKELNTEDKLLEEFVDLLLDEGVERWEEILH